jgi:hypothetical protein
MPLVFVDLHRLVVSPTSSIGFGAAAQRSAGAVGVDDRFRRRRATIVLGASGSTFGVTLGLVSSLAQ